MTWKLSPLNRLTKIQCWWAEFPLRPNFYGFFFKFFYGEYQMYQVIPLYSHFYPCKISIIINLATDEDNSRNEIWMLNKDETGVALKSWRRVQVKLATWELSQLESLIGI